MSYEQRLGATCALLDEIGHSFANVVLANSLGAEDMVLTDLIAKRALPFDVFCLDTGRLPEETHTLLGKLPEHYPDLKLHVYYPDGAALAEWVNANGINAFYHSIEMRKACCALRKVEPLGRALAGRDAWITGMRRAQSATRSELAPQAFDPDHGLMKFNPLADWQEADVWQYLRDHQVPYNALHDKHYPSIGCAPCTRAIAVGEDLRAGRWWWENPETKECGLHISIRQG